MHRRGGSCDLTTCPAFACLLQGRWEERESGERIKESDTNRERAAKWLLVPVFLIFSADISICRVGGSTFLLRLAFFRQARKGIEFTCPMSYHVSAPLPPPRCLVASGKNTSTPTAWGERKL